MNDFDPIELMRLQKVAEENAAELEKKFHRLSARVFGSQDGRKWLGLAMARTNFMGSTFAVEDGFNALAAAHRDGQRSLISEILNSAVQAKPNTDTDDQ